MSDTQEKLPEEEQPLADTPGAEAPEAEVVDSDPLQEELDALKAAMAEQEDRFLRLAAEYDAAWAASKADTAAAFLPVYDNLERALKQETADEAYKKGVEMTMTQLREVLAKLGITEIPALGETFDPKLHNAVMHTEDEDAGENTIVEVFQAGFRTEEKVIRFAMVKVAN